MKKTRKLFFTEKFKKTIVKKQRFENVDELFDEMERGSASETRGINVDYKMHVKSRRNMYTVARHFAGNERMHITRAKAIKMHKTVYKNKTSKAGAEDLYQQLRNTTKSNKVVFLSNYVIHKDIETVVGVRLKRSGYYSVPSHIKTSLNKAIGDAIGPGRGIRFNLWGAITKERRKLDAIKMSTIPRSKTDLKLKYEAAVAELSGPDGFTPTSKEKNEIWGGIMKEEIYKNITLTSEINWSTMNAKIEGSLSRCDRRLQDESTITPEHLAAARKGQGWKTARINGNKVAVHRGIGEAEFTGTPEQQAIKKQAYLDRLNRIDATLSDGSRVNQQKINDLRVRTDSPYQWYHKEPIINQQGPNDGKPAGKRLHHSDIQYDSRNEADPRGVMGFDLLAPWEQDAAIEAWERKEEMLTKMEKMTKTWKKR